MTGIYQFFWETNLTCVIESNTLWIMEYLITCVARQIHLWALHQLWCASITIGAAEFGWVFNLFGGIQFAHLNQTLQQIIDLTAIQMVSDQQTMPNWESNWVFDISALDVKYSIIRRARSGWVGWGRQFSQRSPTRIVRKVKLLGRGWQMMYNEKFCRYCQQPQGPTNTFLVQISKDSRGN